MNKCFAVIFMVAAIATTADAGWKSQMEVYNKWDHQDEYAGLFIPTIIYGGDHWMTHIEYKIPFEPEHTDGVIEWQYELKRTRLKGLALKNELEYNIETDKYKCEITPKWFTKVGEWKLGMELEIDILKENEFDIYEIEIEPTAKRTFHAGSGVFTLEIEAPTTRLYTNTEDKDNFAIEAIDGIFTYKVGVADNTWLLCEAELRYNTEDSMLNKIASFSVIRKL